MIWFQRLLVYSTTESFWQDHIASSFCVPFSDLIHFNVHPAQVKCLMNEKSVIQLFWKDVFHNYFQYTYVSAEKIKTCEYIQALSMFQFSTGWLQCILNFTSIPSFSYFCTFKTCSTQIECNLFVMYRSLNLLLVIFFNTKNNKSYVSVLCSWCLAGNRCKSFKEMEG